MTDAACPEGPAAPHALPCPARAGERAAGLAGRAARYPLSTMTRAALEGMAADLRRQADALEVERPLLVVMLMGGTGVGKSSLLNALAGGAIAHASFTRPTTRDPVVYYHESVKPDRLDPALRHCRLVPHDRPALAQKILVDTPDLDSNDLANREKLFHVLPVADVVLYVGSQEKYHDEIGWQLFLQQRKRRAFAFVMNKWDRCVHGAGSGLRPDEDLLRDLKSEGFENPLLFRTCARRGSTPPRMSADRDGIGAADGPARAAGPAGGRAVRRTAPMAGNGPDAAGGRGHQGPRRRTIAPAIGGSVAVGQSARPDGGGRAAPRIAWAGPLNDEAAATTEVLLNTLEPYQAEIEHHFTVEGQRRFRGVMAGYLQPVQPRPLPRRQPPRQDPVPAEAARFGEHARRVGRRPLRPSVQRDRVQPPARRPRQGAGQPPAGGGREPGLRHEGPGRPGGGGVEDRLAAALRPGHERGAARRREAAQRADRAAPRGQGGARLPGRLGAAHRVHGGAGLLPAQGVQGVGQGNAAAGHGVDFALPFLVLWPCWCCCTF